MRKYSIYIKLLQSRSWLNRVAARRNPLISKSFESRSSKSYSGTNTVFVLNTNGVRGKQLYQEISDISCQHNCCINMIK